MILVHILVFNFGENVPACTMMLGELSLALLAYFFNAYRAETTFSSSWLGSSLQQVAWTLEVACCSPRRIMTWCMA